MQPLFLLFTLQIYTLSFFRQNFYLHFFLPLCAEISDAHQVADDVVGDEQCFAREFQSVAAEF